MRFFTTLLLLIILPNFSSLAARDTGRVIKVLPHYLDLKGRHTLSPSLYDRDAYQAQLRRHPEQCSALRFDILWKAKRAANPKLRIELRTLQEGKPASLHFFEQPVKTRSSFGTWSALTISGSLFKEIGEVTAWRVTLLDGDRLLDEMRSFLW